MRTFAVRYEDGVLKPDHPLPFPPGQELSVTVVPACDPRRWDLARLADAPSDDERRLTEAGLQDWSEMLDRKGHF